jgi:L-aspartate oxidase
LIRTADSLARAIAQLCKWERLVSRPFALRRDLEVKNMVQVARCIAEAALWRENSVGAHYRADYPKLDGPRWKQHSGKQIMDSGNLKASRSGAKSVRRTVVLRKVEQSAVRHTGDKSEALS